jgi:hypothetical protein
MKHFTFILLFFSAIIGSVGQNAATFDELETGPAGYWNGSDGSGRFKSGPFTFHNSYSAEYASWSGFSYSKKSDTLSAGWTNQYSAITGKDIGGGGNYGVGYVFGTTKFTLEKPDSISGMYLTNNTYTYLSMKNGDDFTKKFGGKDGKDPDYFRLLVSGIGEKGDTTGSAYFYLADFRFEDASKDYIVKNWEWFDLRSLGIVSAIHFSLESTDMGAWGMNTPAYFCVDNINRKDFTMITSLPDQFLSTAEVYPTLFSDHFNVALPGGRYLLEIRDLFGRQVYRNIHEGDNLIRISELAALKPGIYLLNIEGGDYGYRTFKLQKLNQ